MQRQHLVHLSWAAATCTFRERTTTAARHDGEDGMEWLVDFGLSSVFPLFMIWKHPMVTTSSWDQPESPDASCPHPWACVSHHHFASRKTQPINKARDESGEERQATGPENQTACKTRPIPLGGAGQGQSGTFLRCEVSYCFKGSPPKKGLTVECLLFAVYPMLISGAHCEMDVSIRRLRPGPAS